MSHEPDLNERLVDILIWHGEQADRLTSDGERELVERAARAALRAVLEGGNAKDLLESLE